MKMAIYVRVSKGEQNPDNQLIKLIDYAKFQGWDYDTFRETESTRNERPVKESVLKKLRTREYQGLLIWKLDRWGRSTSELVIELDEFVNHNIKFVSIQEGIDLSTAAGKLLAHILAAFAEFEREIIRERTMAGLDRARARGNYGGRPKAHVSNTRLLRLRDKDKMTFKQISKIMKVSEPTIRRRYKEASKTPQNCPPENKGDKAIKGSQT